MNSDELKRMRKIAREQELARAKLVGTPRAKSWGKKDRDPKKDRRDWKRQKDQGMP